MKERPILFSAPMVRAILAGQKTQTRRVIQSPAKGMQRERMDVIKYRPPGDPWYKDHVWSMRGRSSVWGDYTHERFMQFCPHGQPGDRLWVKETWKARVSHSCAMDACDCDDVLVSYAAGGYARSSDHDPEAETGPGDVEERWVSGYEIAAHEDRPGGKEWLMPKAAIAGKNVSPLFMPRWASRITLEVVALRAERLQDITEADAKAEGVDAIGINAIPRNGTLCYRDDFAQLWDIINGKRADWALNPWVWVIEFRRVEGE